MARRNPYAPFIEDQDVAAQVYFASIVAMLFIESMVRLPQYFRRLRHQGQ